MSFTVGGGEVAAVDVLLGFENKLTPLVTLLPLLMLADSDISVSSGLSESSGT